MSEYANPAVPTFPAAELDRRFYAYTLDRLLAWTVDAAAALAAYYFLIDGGHVWAGALLVVAVVLVVGLGFSLLLGLRGISPGKAAVGLRVVHHGTGTPIGVGPAMLRSLILGVSALPTFGLGVATLAWTAVMDRGGQRRGWHDHVTHGIVVDVRPIPVTVEEAESGPRHIVNLTAMRLVPATQPVPVSAPTRAPRVVVPPTAGPGQQQPTVATPPLPPTPSSAAPLTHLPAGPPPPVPEPPSQPPLGARSGLGYPLVGPPRHALQPPTQPPTQQPSQPPVQPPAQPAAQPAAPGGHSTAERTVVRSSSGGPLVRWRVTFDTGESFLVEGLSLVGRRPEPRAGEPVRHLVPLRSSDMSLSKTHAQFQVAPDGVLVVMDRGSTNGSILLRQGVSRELAGGKPTSLRDGDQVQFGDRQMTVARES